MRKKRIDHDKDYVINWASKDARDSAWTHMQCWVLDHTPTDAYYILSLWHDIDYRERVHGSWLDGMMDKHSYLWQAITIEEVRNETRR